MSWKRSHGPLGGRLALIALMGVATTACPGDDAPVDTTSTTGSSGDPTTQGPTTVTMTTITATGTATGDTTMSADSGSTGSTTSEPTTTGSSGSSSGDSGSTSGTDGSTGSSSGSESSGTTGDPGPCELMLPPPGMCAGPGMDLPGAQFECNPITQDDCAAGQKCMPWANDGGSSWNATRCSPISAMPMMVGDPCTVEGSGVSGIDDCELGAMCWAVDPANNMGTCIELCSCSYDDPQCLGANTACAVVNSGVLPLCIPACNPLDPAACPAGQGCYPVGELFQCVPDASGAGGAAGDPCEFINVCEPGNICVDSSLYPGCFGTGCCSPTCDVDDPAPGCPAGTGCEAFYGMGMAPDACLASVGICIAP
ncbi:MAG: hypothetical protein KDK70_32725 [Myxococcales bacterium]|nr:hypothetical protein [Myxococcales bacterium]